MSVIASISIDADDFVLGEILADTTTRIELTQFVPVDNQLIPYFWKEHDGDREAFEETVRNHPAVAELSNLDGRVNSHLYRIDWTDEDDGFLNALRDQDILIEEASTTDGETWLFQLRAIDQSELSAFQEACYEHDVPLDIKRVVHNPDMSDRSRGLVGVTPKQERALELALERGFFNVPRDISADELGEELGITGQAFSRRLQRCQQSIFMNLLSKQSRQ
ncbi:helix-turn-helix domain-containing protein [Halococcus thailandensis]|uniref:Bacterio-opsin activator HTH domain-containing protein n=1 Tax=Halococcus thailandensis JCM 13552 TaxID=1227457 RepID=M0N0J7_9EURY|nr:helix-turn-helix domain-containing protein [Halococcus thailandensis]EMA51401.1 bacterio-opsin activator HTH domain-containing protein [Halococcus thailandensis JCM 13552]